MTDKFEDLRTFIAVVQARGFNAAAERLGLVKSAVSRRIRDLEDRLGTRLISRTTRKITPTHAGTAFYERSIRLLDELQDAENAASKDSSEIAGKLRLSVPVSFAAHCLAPLMHEFQTAYPQLAIDLDTTDRLVDLVAEGFDMAIRISHLKDSSLVARKIASIRHVACASPEYLNKYGRPRVPDDLRKHRGVAYGYLDPKQYWMFRDGESVAASHTLSINNGDAIRESAIAGCGVVVLPTFIVHSAIVRGDLEVILNDYARSPVGMHAMYPSHRNLSVKVRLFVDFLVTNFGASSKWDRLLRMPPRAQSQARVPVRALAQARKRAVKA